MLSILNRALSWAITSFGNKFNLKKRSRLIKASDNGFYVKFIQLEIGLLEAKFLLKTDITFSQGSLFTFCLRIPLKCMLYRLKLHSLSDMIISTYFDACELSPK